MAQTLDGYLDLRHITGLSGGDLELDSARRSGGFQPGQPVWMHDAFGLRLFVYIQNRDTAGAFTRGMITSRMGGNNGTTAVTASTATTTSISFAAAALTTNQHVGAIALIGGLAASTAATEGEASIVVSNSSSQINMDGRFPYSAAPVASQVANLIGTYNVHRSVSADTNTTTQGVVIARNGISTGNFGFVQGIGFCPRVEKDTLTTNALFTTGSWISCASGSGHCYQATTLTGLNLCIGKAAGPAPSSATQAALILQMGYIALSGSTTATS